jgi:hypothetical protein
MYEMYTEKGGYYTAVDVPKEVFDKLDQQYFIKGCDDKVKYMLANKAEGDHLESLGINVDRMSDFFKIKLINNNTVRVRLLKELLLEGIPKERPKLEVQSRQGLYRYTLTLRAIVECGDKIITVREDDIDEVGSLHLPEYYIHIRKGFYEIITEEENL